MLASLAWPALCSANHVSITAATGASLTKVKPTSVVLRVSWSAECAGAASGHANYRGDLNLLKPQTGETIYLGGVFSAPGQIEIPISRADKDQAFTPVLRISCFEDTTLHGSGDVTVSGAEVIIPAKERLGGGGGGGGGNGNGGGGGGGAGGDPDEPLQAGGCATELRGSAGADVLNGGDGGDLILAFGGADRVRGRGGHDCLVGSSGGDQLLGEDGYDRLTGGSGADRLDGGPGRNAYDAGSGDDTVKARNGQRETVRCGAGDDTVRADGNDRLRGCEHVTRS
jgi:RTX calcium-binding nonapeptide repeat (4 copies)